MPPDQVSPRPSSASDSSPVAEARQIIDRMGTGLADLDEGFRAVEDAHSEPHPRRAFGAELTAADVEKARGELPATLEEAKQRAGEFRRDVDRLQVLLFRIGRAGR